MGRNEEGRNVRETNREGKRKKRGKGKKERGKKYTT